MRRLRPPAGREKEGFLLLRGAVLMTGSGTDGGGGNATNAHSYGEYAQQQKLVEVQAGDGVDPRSWAGRRSGGGGGGGNGGEIVEWDGMTQLEAGEGGGWTPRVG